jgi:hypothetical protein
LLHQSGHKGGVQSSVQKLNFGRGRPSSGIRRRVASTRPCCTELALTKTPRRPSCCPLSPFPPFCLHRSVELRHHRHRELRRPRVRAPWHREPPKLAHTSATASSASVAPPTSRSSQGEGEFRRFRCHRREPTSPEFMLAMVDPTRAPSSLHFLLRPLYFALGKLVPSSSRPRQPRRRRIAAATWPPAAALAGSGVRLGLGVRLAHQSVQNHVGSA